jgi:dTDP-4-amino-4,6-dideoxygalactose transaminase
MSIFRIHIYLKIKHFIQSFLIKKNSLRKKSEIIISKKTNKKFTILVGQLRVGFYLVLKYLKNKYPDRKEVIMNSYNLAVMVNICKSLGLKVIFVKLNKNLFLSAKELKKKINKNTLAVVATNIFNTSKDIKDVKTICKKKKTFLIEDNAIYFGNYTKVKGKKTYSGTYGDYSLNSFNIMKIISAMYGGSVSTNDSKFHLFANQEIKNFRNFPMYKYFKQCLVFIILKLIAIKLLYNQIFFRILKKAHISNNNFFLSIVYPSLKFKKEKFTVKELTKISPLSLKMIWLQLNNDTTLKKNHEIKKDNNDYYFKMLKKLKIKDLKLINLEDSNFQNFNDFPIFVNKKKELVNFLFNKGIETKTVQYVDCQRLFGNINDRMIEKYEKKVLCLPNHHKVTKKYIEYIVKNISIFYE